jgi:pimeloyl-ACP methyl ester carboxylesterase
VRADDNDTRAPRTAEQMAALALSAWDLDRKRAEWADSERARIIFLRTHKRLQAALEEEQGVPEDSRSWLAIQDGSSEACLLVHDTGGSPADLLPLAEHLHEGGLTVQAMLLPGHGIPESIPAQVTWGACLQEVRLRSRLLRQVHRRVHVVGHGFGADLAIQMAHQEPVSSLVLLAPALVPRVSLLQRMLLRLGLHRVPWLRRHLDWDPQMLAAMARTRAVIGRLRVRIYAAHCEDDERISPLSLRLLQKRSRNRANRFQILPTGGHDLLAAHGQALLNDAIRGFIRA